MHLGTIEADSFAGLAYIEPAKKALVPLNFVGISRDAHFLGTCIGHAGADQDTLRWPIWSIEPPMQAGYSCTDQNIKLRRLFTSYQSNSAMMDLIRVVNVRFSVFWWFLCFHIAVQRWSLGFFHQNSKHVVPVQLDGTTNPREEKAQLLARRSSTRYVSRAWENEYWSKGRKYPKVIKLLLSTGLRVTLLPKTSLARWFTWRDEPI